MKEYEVLLKGTNEGNKTSNTTLQNYLSSGKSVGDFLIKESYNLTAGLDLSPEKLKYLQENFCLILSENLKLLLNESTKHLQQDFQHQKEVLSNYPDIDLRIRTWF